MNFQSNRLVFVMVSGKRIWRCLMFVFILIMGMKSDQFTLNTAVIAPWNNIFNDTVRYDAIPHPRLGMLSFSVRNSRSQYDKIMRAHDQLLENHIHVVVGPFDTAIATATEKLNIPYLATTRVHKKNRTAIFQIPPLLEDFSAAIFDLVKAYKWEKCSYFYDDDQGLVIIEHLLNNHNLIIKTWKLEPVASSRQIRDFLVHMRRAFVQKSIIYCSKKNVRKLLEEARSLAMLSTPYEWFFYDPGDQLTDIFIEFPDVTVNFTLFSLMPYNTSQTFHVKGKDMYNLTLASDTMAVLRDAVPHVLYISQDDDVRMGLTSAISKTLQDRLTGHIEFDEKGKRTNYIIYLSEINGYKHYEIGKYNLSKNATPPLYLAKNIGRANITVPFPLRGRTVKVVTIGEQPFSMHRKYHHLYTGNNRFEGYAVDLIKEIAKKLDFNFELYWVHDGNFGSKLPNGEWNGMIGELLAGNATMSVAPLSINAEREEAVDFTKPFMTRYISVLLKLPRSETSYFEFLNPLHPIVWFCTFGAFIAVSIILYMLEKIGNYRRKGCSAMTFRESLWFVFGSLLQGSTETSPSTLPGRILTSAWWFFALILISSYTANLAAFLTVKKINTPIKSVTDLASQTKIKYGTVKNSGIMAFFKNTNIEHFAKMWAHMSEIDPSSMVGTTEEGFEKVKQANYAFFWDTTVNKYKTIEDCEFMEVGPQFDPKGFGIGVPPGATYRDELSMEILKLSDEGTLHQLENKWWGRRNCPDVTKPSADETSELQIDNMAGVFFILIGGLAAAGIVCAGEYFSKLLHKNDKKEAYPPTPCAEKCTHNEKERESFL